MKMARPRIRFSPIKIPRDGQNKTVKLKLKLKPKPKLKPPPKVTKESDSESEFEAAREHSPAVDLDEQNGYKTDESYNFDELDSSFLSPIKSGGTQPSPVKTESNEVELSDPELESHSDSELDVPVVEQVREVRKQPEQLEEIRLDAHITRSTPTRVGKTSLDEFWKPTEKEGEIGAKEVETDDEVEDIGPQEVEEVKESSSDEEVDAANVDAETTIMKVEQFIQEKRREFVRNGEKFHTSPARKLHSSPHQTLHSSPSRKRKRQDTPAEARKRPRKQSAVSAEDWDSDMWMKLYKHLRRWKETGDADLMKVDVLESLFECPLEELEVRVKTLREVMDRKRRDRSQ